jgi:hypothetical protein
MQAEQPVAIEIGAWANDYRRGEGLWLAAQRAGLRG